MKFEKASKKKAKLRLAITGLAGGGKTWTSLAIGQHLVDGGKIAVIDTERGSASLYANKFSFDVLELEEHAPTDYVRAIELAESSGYDVVVIDSLSHAWVDALETVDNMIDRGAGNKFTSWAKVTPQHNLLVESILNCKAHVIATMRSKVAYALQQNDKGKNEVKKLGLAPVQRSGLDYEFTLVGDIDREHRLTITKTRMDGAVAMDEIIDRPGEVFAKRVRAWLEYGDAPAPAPAPEPEYRYEPHPALMPMTVEQFETGSPPARVEFVADEAFSSYLEAIKTAGDHASLMKAATSPAKPIKGTPEHAVASLAYKTRAAQLRSQS